MNPFGINFFDIKASNLVRLTLDGNVVDGGSLGKGVNDAGYNLHSGILKARKDVNCIIHLHPTDVIAVSREEDCAMKRNERRRNNGLVGS